jgi:hypothetical protein
MTRDDAKVLLIKSLFPEDGVVAVVLVEGFEIAFRISVDSEED